jgi:hypothetical protein
MFVAMGGPRATTPTIDHIPGFTSEQTCADAGKQIQGTVKNSVRTVAFCVKE